MPLGMPWPSGWPPLEFRLRLIEFIWLSRFVVIHRTLVDQIVAGIENQPPRSRFGEFADERPKAAMTLARASARRERKTFGDAIALADNNTLRLEMANGEAVSVLGVDAFAEIAQQAQQTL